LDRGEAGACIFFADFSKGFDLIDHYILIQELDKLQVHPALLSWISAFLFNRRQAVRFGSVLSQWQTLKGGKPQGTKLGVLLFTVMTNSLLANWRLRTKFEKNDTSALKIISGTLSASLILQSLIYMNLLMSIT
jgi:glycerol-3-phosphate acyltransferase PlsY